MASLTLNWLNKAHSRQLAYEPNYPLLKRVSTHVPAGADAALADSPAYRDNWLIQGDNLQALKALLPFYRGQVKCIFIDPPYNTGSAFEHYHDKLEHTQWLHMMYPRLLLLRELLADDGSIWVTLDDNEAHYAKVLMDEVFGRQNFLSTVVWQKTTSVHNNATAFSSATDFALVYTKIINNFKMGRAPRSERNSGDYSNPDNDARGDWASSPLHVSLTSGQRGKQYAQTGKSSGLFPLISPHGEEIFPPRGRAWAYSIESIAEFEKQSLIWWGKLGQNQPRLKRFKNENKEGVVPGTLWLSDEVGHNQEAKAENMALLSVTDELFSTPKPERLLERVLTLATNPNDLVLDSFLGSGTTAAVAHKMGRRYIGIEMGEHALTHCQPRLEKVIAGEQGGVSSAVGWQGGGAFSTYGLGAQVFITQGKDKGKIDPAVRFADLAAYVWQQETRLPATQAFTSPCLGATQHDEGHRTAYYLLYNGILGDKRPESGNVLTYEVLAALDACFPFTASDGQRVVFGEACRVSPATLARANMSFKKIPYSLRAGKMI